MPQEDEVVRRAPLFTALDDAQAASLRASMDSVKISKGGILFKEGDEGEHVYVIFEGKLKLGTSSGDGRENLLSILGPGEMFGELSLFDPGPRTSTATANCCADSSATMSHASPAFAARADARAA